jgi:hypothetical protein
MTSKYEMMARWQRVCILRQMSRHFQELGLGSIGSDEVTGRAVIHAANQEDYIITELPPPVATAIGLEVGPVYRRAFSNLDPVGKF